MNFLAKLIRWLAEHNYWGPCLFFLDIIAVYLWGALCRDSINPFKIKEILLEKKFLVGASILQLAFFIIVLLFPELDRISIIRIFFEENSLNFPEQPPYICLAIILLVGIAFISAPFVLSFLSSLPENVLVVRVAHFKARTDESERAAQDLREKILRELEDLQKKNAPIKVHRLDVEIPGTSKEEIKGNAQRVAGDYRTRCHLVVTGSVWIPQGEDPEAQLYIIKGQELGKRELQSSLDPGKSIAEPDVVTLRQKAAAMVSEAVTLIHGKAYYATEEKNDLKKAIEIFNAYTPPSPEISFYQGNAHYFLVRYAKGKDFSKLLEKAISHYQYCLESWPETDFPKDWAMTMNNMGIAYRDLPSGDRAKNLETAIDCYEKALRVRTETDFPVYYAQTRANLGFCMVKLFKESNDDEYIAKARQCFSDAARAFRTAGIESEAKKMDDLVSVYKRN